ADRVGKIRGESGPHCSCQVAREGRAALPPAGRRSPSWRGVNGAGKNSIGGARLREHGGEYHNLDAFRGTGVVISVSIGCQIQPSSGSNISLSVSGGACRQVGHVAYAFAI